MTGASQLGGWIVPNNFCHNLPIVPAAILRRRVFLDDDDDDDGAAAATRVAAAACCDCQRSVATLRKETANSKLSRRSKNKHFVQYEGVFVAIVDFRSPKGPQQGRPQVLKEDLQESDFARFNRDLPRLIRIVCFLQFKALST